MSKNSGMPQAPTGRPAARLQPELSPRALERWNPGIKAASTVDADEAHIGIYDVIGDYWGEGFTAARMAGFLRSIGNRRAVVSINSPGGDVFEGFAIYNLLRAHNAGVTIKVLGMAASAASVIAMAGERVEVARAGFLMIHNCWGVVIGNRNDLRRASDDLEQFDDAMVGIYHARTGLIESDLSDMLDDETWMNGKDAISKGFCDAYLPADELDEDMAGASKRAALNKIDVALAKAGMARSERRRLIGEIKDQAGTLRAADENSTPSAAEPVEVEPIDTSCLTSVFQNLVS